MQYYNKEQWESICCHCGKCCLIKLEDEDTGDLYYTNVVCRYFDEEKMLCSVYKNRCNLVPSCVKLSPDNVDKIDWMPKSCAYRKLFEKSPSNIKTTIKGRVVNECDVKAEELEDYIVDWEDL